MRLAGHLRFELFEPVLHDHQRGRVPAPESDAGTLIKKRPSAATLKLNAALGGNLTTGSGAPALNGGPGLMATFMIVTSLVRPALPDAR